MCRYSVTKELLLLPLRSRRGRRTRRRRGRKGKRKSRRRTTKIRTVTTTKKEEQEQFKKKKHIKRLVMLRKDCFTCSTVHHPVLFCPLQEVFEMDCCSNKLTLKELKHKANYCFQAQTVITLQAKSSARSSLKCATML